MQKRAVSDVLVGLHIDSRFAFFRQVAEAASAYLKEQDGVQVFDFPEKKLSVFWDHAGPSGLLTNDGGLAPQKKPLVVISNAKRWPGVMKVVNDDVAIGRAAAVHLVEAGADRLLCVDWLSQPLNDLRMQGFQEAGKERGVEVDYITLEERLPVEVLAYLPALEEELYQVWRGYAAGTGLFMMNDHAVLWMKAVVDKRDPGVFPGDVLIVGVDNTGASDPEANWLSSVEPDAEGLGRAAAKLLLDWIRSGQRPEAELWIPPLGVVGRSSTLRFAEGSLVRRAMGRIRSGHYPDDSAETLAASLGVSRVTLFRHFKQELGKTPHEVLHEHQLQRARTLLRESREPLEAIALQCGYSHASTFIKMFQKEEGMTPGEWRRMTSTE